MIHFSLPTSFGIFVASSAVAVASVAVAVPMLNTDQQQTTSTVTETATPTPTPTTSTDGSTGGSPLSAYGNPDLGNGVMLQEVALGLSANVRRSGVTFSYVGSCTGDGAGSGAAMTIWGNNGQQKSWGSGGYCNGGLTFASTSMVWGEDTRNSYCYSPLGGSSAYRAEVFGQFSEWVAIPAEYMQCMNGQAPEVPAVPTPVVPAMPSPTPSTSDSSSPSPTASSTP